MKYSMNQKHASFFSKVFKIPVMMNQLGEQSRERSAKEILFYLFEDIRVDQLE